MPGPDRCPIENTLKHIGKKWTINIIRDLFFGKRRFRDFLERNPKLSTKMLSARLKEMEKDNTIVKNIISKSPVIIEYSLTEKGKALARILYELARYSIEYHPSEIFDKRQYKKESLLMAKQVFG